MNQPTELAEEQQERRCELRMDVPMGANYAARFKLGARAHELQIIDFTPRGLALRTPRLAAAGLHVGRELTRVQLELGSAASLVVDLEIRLAREFRSFLAGQQVHIGCRYINLTPAVASALAAHYATLQASRRRA